MSRCCDIFPEKKTVKGNNVSHSNRKVKRTFKSNIHSKTYALLDEEKDVSYAYAPYEYSRETAGWPYHTGHICHEDPSGGKCLGEKSPHLDHQFCKTEHPLDFTDRTSILNNPTPAPLHNSLIFNEEF